MTSITRHVSYLSYNYYICSHWYIQCTTYRLIHFTVCAAGTATSKTLQTILYNEITVMCTTRGFMVGLGNNGFTNPIISSYLEISSTYNPFSSRFPFPVAIHRCNVCRVNGLHNIPPLLPPGDHARVQNSWHLLE